MNDDTEAGVRAYLDLALQMAENRQNLHDLLDCAK